MSKESTYRAIEGAEVVEIYTTDDNSEVVIRLFKDNALMDLVFSWDQYKGPCFKLFVENTAA